jgi:endoglucanase
MNEPHDIDASIVAGLVSVNCLTITELFSHFFIKMQAGINGVRSSGATNQLILVEGTSWTGAWSE